MSDAMPEGLDGEMRGVQPVHNQSVLKAVALIGCFVDRTEGSTLTELARRTGMNVSTAYRMLQTLTHTGVLRRNAGGERYFAGPLLLALAGATFSSGGYGPAADVLRGLADETGESVSLGIRDAECVVVLLSVGSSQQLRFEHHAGARVPMHTSAMGKALLAYGPEPYATSVRGLGRLRPLTPRSIVRADVLVTDLEATRDRGYAIADEEQHVGVRSVAVVARRGDEPPRAALSVQGPVARMTTDRIEAVVAVLRQGADLVAQLPLLDRLPEP